MPDGVFQENIVAAPAQAAAKPASAQKLIDSGPYEVVRHPLYAAAAIIVLSGALIVGSWWSMAGALAVVLALAWWSEAEEKTLATQVEGYEEYRQRVRWRLLPHVW